MARKIRGRDKPINVNKAANIRIEVRAHRFKRNTPMLVVIPQTAGAKRNKDEKAIAAKPGVGVDECGATAAASSISAPNSKVSIDPRRENTPTTVTPGDRCMLVNLSPGAEIRWAITA